ncbi:hypothetical protein GUJ93_ZPchr0009g2244 [Zizania palustris]|uniref:Uncharacterized protein n=1 Tax=Zizania palustris TaxID=103762 RepID=A0A8J5RKH1_ZIZPA|nr:hypothetical protein GUJ93_ZPchr0009g2244 [Zizania palustris]
MTDQLGHNFSCEPVHFGRILTLLTNWAQLVSYSSVITLLLFLKTKKRYKILGLIHSQYYILSNMSLFNVQSGGACPSEVSGVSNCFSYLSVHDFCVFLQIINPIETTKE